MQKIFAMVWAGLACAAVCAGDTQNSDDFYRQAQIGQWTHYKFISTEGEKKSEATVRTVVTQRNDEQVNLEITTDEGGRKSSAMLSVNFESQDRIMERLKREHETIEEGDEVLKLGNTEYKCHWTKSKLNQADGQITGFEKVWKCPSVPLESVVKRESELTVTANGKSFKRTETQELLDCSKERTK